MRNFEIDQVLGFLPNGSNWTPSIRYILRRHPLIQIFKNWKTGRLLEVGCGAGTLLCELALEGHKCYFSEFSSEAEILAKTHFSLLPSNTPIKYDQEIPKKKFDYIIALDVLEHIKDDSSTLAEWIALLAPGGTLLLSVPCHKKKWGAGDEWAGHYRRYEKTDLYKLISKHQVSIAQLNSYGFPLANITEAIGNIYYRRHLINKDKHEASKQSGTNRSFYGKLRSLLYLRITKAIILVFIKVQKLFKTYDIGSGYILVLQKSNA